MNEQISIFDFMDDAKKDLPLGYLRTDAEVKRYKGDVIPFQELEQYVGKQVLYEMPREGMTDYKVVQITSYHKGCDLVCRADGSDEMYVDRIGYTDDNRRKKENSWVSEMFFGNGRGHDEEDRFPVLMYEIKEKGE